MNQEASSEHDPQHAFADRLRAARERAGLSQSALARLAGIDASYLNRLERAEREPPKQPTAQALAAGLGLNNAEADELLVAAGHLPHAIAQLGPLDPTLRLVANVLTDAALAPDDQAEFRLIIGVLARRWHSHALSAQSPANAAHDM